MTKNLSAFALLACASLSLADGTVQWQQVGGGLSVAPSFTGLVSQGYETPLLDDGTIAIQAGFLAHPLLQNTPPFVVSGLEDRTLPQGFATRSESLEGVFADFEGPLTYDVTSTGTGSQATVEGPQLVLTGVGSSGIAQFIVTASDGTFSVADTFSVSTEASTAIVAKSPRTPVAQELAVVLTKTFATQASGPGRGELTSASLEDDAHSLAVNLLLPAAGWVSVHIFDLLGNPVIDLDRTLDAVELRRLAASGDGRKVLPVIWNLRSANGLAVATGVFLWQIEMRTVSGQKLTTCKRLGVKGVN